MIAVCSRSIAMLIGMSEHRYDLRPIGWVHSSLVDPADVPKQGDDGAPEASSLSTPA